jgi:hypothetical protein
VGGVGQDVAKEIESGSEIFLEISISTEQQQQLNFNNPNMITNKKCLLHEWKFRPKPNC